MKRLGDSDVEVEFMISITYNISWNGPVVYIGQFLWVWQRPDTPPWRGGNAIGRVEDPEVD
jgi:hypothetical protein